MAYLACDHDKVDDAVVCAVICSELTILNNRDGRTTCPVAMAIAVRLRLHVLSLLELLLLHPPSHIS